MSRIPIHTGATIQPGRRSTACATTVGPAFCRVRLIRSAAWITNLSGADAGNWNQQNGNSAPPRSVDANGHFSGHGGAKHVLTAYTDYLCFATRASEPETGSPSLRAARSGHDDYPAICCAI